MESQLRNIRYSDLTFSEEHLCQLLTIFQSESIGFVPKGNQVLFKVQPLKNPPQIRRANRDLPLQELVSVFYTPYKPNQLKSALDLLKFENQLITSVPYYHIKEEKEEIPNIKNTEKSVDSRFENFFIRENGWLKKIKIKDILYFHLEGTYAQLQCNSRSFVLRITTKKLLEKLKNRNFIQVSKSYLINLAFLKGMSQTEVEINDKVLPVGKKYRKHLLERINIL